MALADDSSRRHRAPPGDVSHQSRETVTSARSNRYGLR